MRQQLAVIAIIGLVLLSGCSMLGIGNNSDVDQPTAQPNTVTGDHEVTSTDDAAETRTVSSTPTERIGNVVTQPPDSTGGDTDTGTSTDTPIDSDSDDESQSDATPRPTDSPSDGDSSIGDGETEIDDDTATPDDGSGDETGTNETDTNDTDGSNETETNESTALPESGLVIGVNEANVIVVEDESGEKRTVRLIGIDVPATVDSNANPSSWGFNDTDASRSWITQHGLQAREFTVSKLLDEHVRIMSVRRGDNGTVVAKVFTGNTHINTALLSQGYAQEDRDDYPFIATDEYGESEYWAKDDDRGIWGYDQ